MLSSLLLSALTVSAAPAKRQDLGNTSGYLIQLPVTPTSPYGASNLCLATNPTGAGGLGDGTPVGFVDCHSVQTLSPTNALYGLWNIQPGNQLSVQLVGTNYCLDAGTNPGSDPSVPAKVWQCYPGLAQQQFYYTDTDHIAVTGYTPCLDYSSSAGTNFVACGSNYNNGDIQSFTLMAVGSASSTSMASTSSMTPTSTMAPSSTSSSAPAATGKVIYWQNGQDYSQCLTVTNGQFYDGSPVGIAPCAWTANQMWVYSDPGVTSIQVAGQNYCIDFGDNGGYDGVPMKIWQCYPGLFQQTMYYTQDNHIAVYNGNQCLDVKAGTQNVQGWQCSGPDVHQHWASAGPA
ncbi:ricin B lectin domain-containing protein [Kockovaella imperatae]|uniref:Ricin B lectin domain-containing protein n=1 Tax=Kockovaella imperatae TaxID=4999 RepID=A0A1Y1UHJ7_9TREE|nr:ricin B lectin domain-containing protein [Kockovaella imperatae]ORX36966.1 ricin B lectin domain-containing protein [Kockovaella imperatae]